MKTIWQTPTRILLLPALVGIFLASAGTVYGQADLPKAETLIEKNIDATGGKAAIEKLKTRMVKGTIENAAQGFKGDLTLYHMRPNLIYSHFEIPNLMKQERGFDGKIGWEKDTTQGARLMEGAELEQLCYDADIDGDLRWRERYPKVETIALEDVNGKPAYKVELTDKKGKKTTNYYDKDTGQIVKASMIYESHMGDLPIDIFYEDFKKVDDFTIPHKMRQMIMNMEQVITYNSVENNAKIEKDLFALPEDVKALVKARQAEKQDDAGKTEKPEKP